MGEENKTKLFREKSLEAVESPEALNDYLRVTTPGMWLVMAAVIVLLLGGILWGIFGRIETTARVAVTASEGSAVCYVPYDKLKPVMSKGTINVNGKDYALRMEENAGVTIITEDVNPYVRVAGELKVGDVTVKVPVEGALEDGVYTGSVVTESLQPMSLLFH